ncbi:MAG: hypothetical protein PVF74_04075, partial [Anaerolineales bacterium]
MDDRILENKLDIVSPARYRILVKGGLDKRWSDRLGGMEIKVSCPEEDFVVTQLNGEVTDQAALFGVLNTLYELHLPLISVDLLNDDNVYTIYKQ